MALLAGTGLAFGVLTAYAQGWLPVEVGSLANSAGAWTLLAFGVVLLTARPERPASRHSPDACAERGTHFP